MTPLQEDDLRLTTVAIPIMTDAELDMFLVAVLAHFNDDTFFATTFNMDAFMKFRNEWFDLDKETMLEKIDPRSWHGTASRYREHKETGK